MDFYGFVASQVQSSIQHVVLGATGLAAIGSVCSYLRKRQDAIRFKTDEKRNRDEPSSDKTLRAVELTSTAATICLATVQSVVVRENKLKLNHVLVAGLSFFSATAFSLWKRMGKTTINQLQLQEVASLPAICPVPFSRCASLNELDDESEINSQGTCTLIETCGASDIINTSLLNYAKHITLQSNPSIVDAIVICVNNDETIQVENVLPYAVQDFYHRATSLNACDNAKVIDSTPIIPPLELNKIKRTNWVFKQWKKLKGSCKKTYSKVKQGLNKKGKDKRGKLISLFTEPPINTCELRCALQLNTDVMEIFFYCN